MVNPDRESYQCFNVDRPILAGGDRFLVAAAHVGREVLGLFAATAPAEWHLQDEQVEGSARLVATHNPLDHPVLDVYSPQDLKMVLMRRVAPKIMSARYNFSHLVGELTTRRKPAGSRSRGKVSHRPGKNTEDLLDDISTQAGERADNARILCETVTEGHDPVLGNFLALLPKSGTGQRLILGKQAEMAFDQVEALNPRIARGANPSIPMVPFASIPHDISRRQYERLIEGITSSEILPVSLVMGAVDIYNNSTVPRQNTFLTAED